MNEGKSKIMVIGRANEEVNIVVKGVHINNIWEQEIEQQE